MELWKLDPGEVKFVTSTSADLMLVSDVDNSVQVRESKDQPSEQVLTFGDHVTYSNGIYLANSPANPTVLVVVLKT